MRFSEPIASLRRVPVYLVTTTGTPVTGAAPTGAELQVSKSGSAWNAAAGSWFEIGLGTYRYEATQAETETSSFLAVRVAVSGSRPYVYAVDVGARIAPDAVPAARRVPVYLVDTTGTPVTGVTGATMNVSLAGAAFATATGTLTEIGLGAYVYELAQAELVEGIGILRVAHASAQTFVFSWDVQPADAELAASPAPIAAPIPTDAAVPTIDHVTAAIGRLPSQYRSAPNG